MDDAVRRGGVAAVAGGALWSAGWLLDAFADTDDWRALLNPAVPLLLMGLLALHRRLAGQGGSAAALGAVLGAVGLSVMLAGNVVMVGLFGDGVGSARGLGVALFGFGWIVCAYGLLVLTFAVIREGRLAQHGVLALIVLMSTAIAVPLHGIGWIVSGRLLGTAPDWASG